MQHSLKLKLPYPISVNAIWRSNRQGAWRRSKAYREWRRAAGWEIRMQMGGLSDARNFGLYTCDRIYLSIFVGRPDQRRRDIDNLTKVICDILQQFQIIRDDCLIERLSIERHDDVSGCEVSIQGTSNKKRSGALAA